MIYYFQKQNPVTIGVIHKPPKQTRFLEQIITEFETLDLNDEHYVLGDFNINLFFKGKGIFATPNEFRQFYREISSKNKKNILSFVRQSALSSLLKVQLEQHAASPLLSSTI